MGAGGSSIDPAEFETLKRKMTSIESSVNSLNSLKTQVDSLASAAAKQISYSDLALAITNNDNNKNALATAIANNPNKLGEALASSIGTNTTVIQSLQDRLGTNTTFQTAMADTLSSDKYKVKFQGPRGADGNIGDAGALKSNLFDQGRTLWCADGELCKIPKDKKGIDIGGGWTISGGTDFIIEKTRSDGSKAQFRLNGGGNDDAAVSGKLEAKSIKLGPWNIFAEGNNDGALVFQKGGGTKHFKIHTDNDSQVQIGGWRIRQQGENLQFDREGQGEKAWVSGTNQVGKIMGLGHRHYRMRSDGGNRCMDFNSGRGWEDCGMNNNQRVYFDQY